MSYIEKIMEVLPNYTYDEYKNWEGKWELIYGIPHAMSPAPLKKHQHISSLIDRELGELFEECEECEVLLPVDWKIDETTVVQPDNSVICHIPKNEAYITKAPKIIFEILSPSTAKKDKTIKHIFEIEDLENL